MLILESVNEAILSYQPESPPETGGILGGRGGIVTDFRLDDGSPTGKLCSYTPNTVLLNETIRRWQREKIEFMGVFHTHFFGVDTLSDSDMRYVEAIMKNMPPPIEQLYFPIIVMPQRKFSVYCAVRKNGEVIIFKDELKLV